MTEPTAHTREVSGASAALRTVERYVEFWNAATADEQRRLAATTFSDQVSYHAPVGVRRGVEALIGMRDQFARRMPDFVFRARTEPQTHHARARLQWELSVAGESFAAGTDVLELDDHGHVTAVTTFLDRAPSGHTPLP